MADFTGAPCERISLKELDPKSNNYRLEIDTVNFFFLSLFFFSSFSLLFLFLEKYSLINKTSYGQIC